MHAVVAVATAALAGAGWATAHHATRPRTLDRHA